MLNTVYCRNCRETIDPADMFCKKCGADQRQPAQPPQPVPTVVMPTVPAPRKVRTMSVQGVVLIIGMLLVFFGISSCSSSAEMIRTQSTKDAQAGLSAEYTRDEVRKEGEAADFASKIAVVGLLVSFLSFFIPRDKVIPAAQALMGFGFLAVCVVGLMFFAWYVVSATAPPNPSGTDQQTGR